MGLMQAVKDYLADKSIGTFIEQAAYQRKTLTIKFDNGYGLSVIPEIMFRKREDPLTYEVAVIKHEPDGSHNVVYIPGLNMDPYKLIEDSASLYSNLTPEEVFSMVQQVRAYTG